MQSWSLKSYWPLVVAAVLAGTIPVPAEDDYQIPAARKNHWAWKPPVRPALPAVNDRAWARNPIDLFILARLESAGLTPASPASREQFVRRVTFDLIGLPPTLKEIDAFVGDPSPNAYEKMIDRLLASPQYGERWGRHWLDLARFAESNGFEFDEARPNAWRYRDYVIGAFNRDLPYDRFIKEQLAGDELFPRDLDALVATGFNVLGPDMTDASDQAARRQHTLNDMTDTTGLVFLGLTITCARCHDHKFEPIPQTDYYRLQAFFTPAASRRDLPISTEPQRAAHEAASKQYASFVKPTQDALASLEEPYRRRLFEAKLARLSDEAQAAHKTPPEKRSPTQKELVEKTTRLLGIAQQDVFRVMTGVDRERQLHLLAELKQFDSLRPAPLPVAMGLHDASTPAPKTFVLERGELGNPGEEVQAGFPVILVPDQKPSPTRIEPVASSTTGRRTALAGWVVSPDNPLTARVLVNRLWQHHFGRGLVGTPSDFGIRGARPTHPELLDWLATELVRRGWSIKQMHRLLLLSATYRQSSQASAAALAWDPENRLSSHMNRLRLEGEIIRDSLLAASGRLNRKMGGPGIFPPIPPAVQPGLRNWKVSPDTREHRRRSVYIFAQRNVHFPFLESFDLPDSTLSCPKRAESTTAPQALALLNASDVTTASESLADRIATEASSEPERITLAYRLALGRRPSARERALAHEFLAQSPLSELCRALYNINEFVYLD